MTKNHHGKIALPLLSPSMSTLTQAGAGINAFHPS
jgi:hypothetical protein